MDLRGKRALVIGMKKSGMASAELLVRQGAEVRATDLKPLEELPGAREVLERLGIPFERQTPAVFEGRDLIVLSPDVPADLAPLEAARARGVRVIGEVELAAPFLEGRTIGITGSNGKTTTTTLVGHILREAGVPVQVGGNIGTPVTAMIETSRADGWNVLELSSFQLETIADFRADIGAGAQRDTESPGPPPHLRELRRRQGPPVRNAAARRFRGAERRRPGLRGVRGAHRRRGGMVQRKAGRFARREPARRDPGARRPPADGGGRDPHTRTAQRRERAGGRRGRGARGSRAAERIAAAVRTFQAVEHRLEFVRSVGGIDFYNDSKATSVDATLKALDAFSGGLWVILGGKDKGLDYTALRAPLAAQGARRAADRRGGGQDRRPVAAGPCPWWTPARWRRPWPTLSATDGRETRCCWRRPAPASISSRASNIAARFSRRL